MNAVEASNPTAVVMGTVSTVSPLKVCINKSLELPGELIVICASLKDRLKSGDRVVLLRQQGGQQYVLLDKVVDEL